MLVKNQATVIFLAMLAPFAMTNIQSSCKQAGLYAMTWDDGPGQYSGQLLDILDQKKIKATFHLTTKYLTDPNIQSMIQRIAAAGHLIGLRTEADWNLFQMSDEQIRASIARQANVMASFIGYYPMFIRLPYNGYDDRVLKAVESTGAIVTTHNLETYDYTNDGGRTFNAVKLALSLVGKGRGSFISVQHDGVQQSVGVAGKIIDLIQSSGYKMTTLDECLGLGDMTKNKDPLKGADDSVGLDPMSGGDLPGGAGSSKTTPPSESDPLGSQAAQAKNAASGLKSATALVAVMIACLAAVLLHL